MFASFVLVLGNNIFLLKFKFLCLFLINFKNKNSFFCHAKAYLITLYNNILHLVSLMKIIKLYSDKQSKKYKWRKSKYYDFDNTLSLLINFEIFLA